MPKHQIDLNRLTMVDSLVEEAAFKVSREFRADVPYVVYASGRSHIDFLCQVAERIEIGLQALPGHLQADWAMARFFIQREPTGSTKMFDGVGVVPIRAADV